MVLLDIVVVCYTIFDMLCCVSKKLKKECFPNVLEAIAGVSLF